MVYPSPTAKQIQQEKGLNEDSLAWSFYNSVSSLFAIVGPLACSGLLRVFHQSRKRTVFGIAVAGASFWFLNCLTKVNIWIGVAVRAFLGVVMGAYSAISPMYMIEIAPKDAEGFFGCLTQIGIVTGLVLFDFIGPSLSYIALNIVGGFICVAQAISIWFIEESKADHELDRQKGDDSLKVSLSDNTIHEESLFQKENLFGLFIGIAMMLFQQFCGINAILTNLAPLMDQSGLKIDGNYQAGIASLAQLLAVFVAGGLMDKLGRRLCWIISTVIIVVFLVIFAIDDKLEFSPVLPLVCIFLYQLGFGLGMGPIPWFIIPEYFSDELRPTATAIVSGSNWIFAFGVIFMWPAMKKGIGLFGSLVLFACVTFVAVIFGILCIREPPGEEEKVARRTSSCNLEKEPYGSSRNLASFHEN
jgi:MFS family permease